MRNYSKTLCLLGFLISVASTARAVTPVGGRVFDATNCAGVANLIVKFEPPKKSGGAIVVTSTDRQGNFQVNLSGPGQYYVSVFKGPQQIYGRVVSIINSAPLSIPLNAKGRSTCR